MYREIRVTHSVSYLNDIDYIGIHFKSIGAYVDTFKILPNNDEEELNISYDIKH